MPNSNLKTKSTFLHFFNIANFDSVAGLSKGKLLSSASSTKTHDNNCQSAFQTDMNGNGITLSLKNSTRSEVSVGTKEQQSQGSFNGLAEASSLLPEN